MRFRADLATVVGVALIGLAACGGSSTVPSVAAPSSASTAAATPSPVARQVAPSVAPSPSVDPWTADLVKLDAAVRRIHPAPFTIHPESEWTSKLAELRASGPAASADEQLVQIASLVGLLDTHTFLDGPRNATFYELLLFPFSEGLFVIRAKDPSWVGARLVSISGVPIDQVEKRLTPLVPHDNHSGLLDGIQGLYSSVEYLHGAGIVADPAKPGFALEKGNGGSVVVDPSAVSGSAWETEFGIVGDLVGDHPEAVARRTESVWWRVEPNVRVFHLAYNDYADPTEALAAMQAALDTKAATRVVVDLRYLRGGNGSIAFPLVQALAAEKRIATAGGLTVLIGRENVSAGTVIDRMLDEQTSALLVGEPSPARADGFLCDCVDVALPATSLVVSLPTYTFHTGDPRPEIAPEVSMPPTAKDFFAGHDRVLDAALAGLAAPRS
jgi:hypothetical protein